MSSGLLCVTTDVGDAPYLLDDCGILVPKNNPAALAEAIRKMVFLSAEEQDVLRFKSRQRIIEHFSILFPPPWLQAVYESQEEFLIQTQQVKLKIPIELAAQKVPVVPVTGVERE